MRQGYTCLWRKIWDNTLLGEPGRQFSRREAWIYITNKLAAGLDNPTAGLKRGEFMASTRQLAEWFNWSRGSVLRFLEILLQNSMIMRVGHSTGQDAGHFSVCNYKTYNSPPNTERITRQTTFKEGFKESIKKEKRIKTHTTENPAPQDVCVSGKTLLEIYQQHNQSLPEVKALTSERLKKCRSRINQAVRDGCLEQYLADFASAVKKAQSTPFLRGEGSRGWRASFDWFVGNHVNVYGVLEGKYDGNGGVHDHGSFNGRENRQPGRTSRGDLLYIPRQ
jgi:hypothetical protein